MTRWLIVLAVVAAAELLLRFVVPLSQPAFLVSEGVLFLVGAAALEATAARAQWALPIRRTVAGWVTALFALGGLRSLLWGLGTPVAGSNLVVLGVAVAVLGLWLWRRRR